MSNMTTETEKLRIAFDEGVCYALDYLAEIFDGITETDLWRDYIGDTDDTETENN